MSKSTQALVTQLNTQQDWSSDAIYDLFHVLRQASGGLVSEKDVAMVHSDALALLIGDIHGRNDDGCETDRVQNQLRFGEVVRGARMTLMTLPLVAGGSGPSSPLLLMAYVPEWKHWYVCCSPGCEASAELCKKRFAHCVIHLARLNIIAECNHTYQFYTPSRAGATRHANIYAHFYSFVMMKNIGHFAYRDEFSACLQNELSLLTDQNYTQYVQRLRNLL